MVTHSLGTIYSHRMEEQKPLRDFSQYLCSTEEKEVFMVFKQYVYDEIMITN